MKHLGTKIITTERLILRPFRVSDYKDMYNNWANDERVCKYTTWSPHINPENSKSLLELWVNDYQNNNYYNWGIEYQNKLIGNISVVKFDEETKTAHIGYCMGYDYWGKGIMTEAFKSVILFLFNDVKVKSILASYDINNPASGRVMEKCGLKTVGQKTVENKNEKITLVLKEITADEFLSLNS